MSNYRAHTCQDTDEMGDHVKPKMVVCGIEGHAWCERCDPAPSALCPICHGRGHTTAPIPPRQARQLWGGPLPQRYKA